MRQPTAPAFRASAVYLKWVATAVALVAVLVARSGFDRSAHALADEKAAAAKDSKDEPKDKEGSDGAEADADGWQSLFDGKTLEGWERANFGGGEEPIVEDGN